MRKMRKMYQSVIFLFFAGMMCVSTNAQVNVGTNEDPISGALLQLRDNEKVTGDAANASKGLAFPRVSLSDSKELYPMFLKTSNDPSSGPTDHYKTNKATLDKEHTGLVVYNLTDDTKEGLVSGLTEWDGSRWVSLLDPSTRSLKAAVFELLYCDDIIVEGDYWEGEALNSENSITLMLNVITPGYYTINATTDNGYSFSKEGVVQKPGWTEIELDAKGTPTKAQEDELSITGIGEVCQHSVYVDKKLTGAPGLNNSWADYDAVDIKVKGLYYKGKNLDNTNVIEIELDVKQAGDYQIMAHSGVSSNIQFQKAGTFSETGLRTVTLKGTGAPTTTESIPLTVSFILGSAGVFQAEAVIEVSVQEITYAVIGTNNNSSGLLSAYFWSRTPRQEALKLSSNFGTDPNSTVKVNNFHMLWDAGPNTAAEYLEDGYDENGTKKWPDIILYNTYGLTKDGKLLPTRNYLTTALVKQLAEYVKKGGCLIFGASNDEAGTYSNRDDTNNLLEKIYEGITPVPYVAAEAKNKTGGLTRADNTFVIRNEPNDPIIKGPFYDLSGGDKYWGEDNQGNVVLPRDKRPNTVKQICSAHNEVDFAGEDPDDSIVWYDTHFNLFFFGDSAGSTQNPKYALGDIDFPALYVDGKPQSKLYGVGLSGIKKDKQIIYNAYLEMNAVAWAIDRAINHGGINFK